jgi:polyisoprenyl-phosphate glycosyltransferase
MDEFLISIVIPVYHEGQQIRENLHIIHDILFNSRIEHEFVIVDDGSKDNTWDEVKKASFEIPGVNAIRFSRNFGKEAALCAGLEAVKGDACVVIDSDLQHPPSLIPEMVRLWKEEGYEVVEGVKSFRGKESIVNKLGASLFYDTLRRLSGYDLNMASDFKLLDVKVVSAILQMPERHTFFRGMSAWVGFRRMSIPFVVQERAKGNSKWSVLKLSKLALNAITSFSALPLQLVTFLGIAFLLGALVLGVQTVYMKLSGIAFSGFTTVILLLLLIGSALMISLGIIGTYIAKIFDEVKNRPRFLIKETTDDKSKIKVRQ